MPAPRALSTPQDTCRAHAPGTPPESIRTGRRTQTAEGADAQGPAGPGGEGSIHTHQPGLWGQGMGRGLNLLERHRNELRGTEKGGEL